MLVGTLKGDTILIKNDILDFYDGNPLGGASVYADDDTREQNLVAYRSKSTPANGFSYYIVDPLYVDKNSSATRPLFIAGDLEATGGVNPKVNASLFINRGYVIVQNVDLVPDIAICSAPTPVKGVKVKKGEDPYGSLDGSDLATDDLINEVTDYICKGPQQYSGVYVASGAAFEMYDSTVDTSNAAGLTRMVGSTSVYAQSAANISKPLDSPPSSGTYRNNPNWGVNISSGGANDVAFFENVNVINKGRYAINMPRIEKAYLEGGDYAADVISIAMFGVTTDKEAKRFEVPKDDTTHKATDFTHVGNIFTGKYDLLASKTDLTELSGASYGLTAILSFLDDPSITSPVALTINLSQFVTPSALATKFGVLEGLFDDILEDFELTTGEAGRIEKKMGGSLNSLDTDDLLATTNGYPQLTKAVRALALYGALEQALLADSNATARLFSVTGADIDLGGDVLTKLGDETTSGTDLYKAINPSAGNFFTTKALATVDALAEKILADEEDDAEAESEEAAREKIDIAIFEVPEFTKKAVTSWTYGYDYDYDYSYNYKYDYNYTVNLTIVYENPLFDGTSSFEQDEEDIVSVPVSFKVVKADNVYGANPVAAKTTAAKPRTKSQPVNKEFADTEELNKWLGRATD